MNFYKKLINDSFIFAIGTLGSKVVSFLLVPLYTHYLSTSEYGTVDLTITTVNMLLPVVSVCMYEAILRFTMDDNKNIEIIVTNIAVLAFISFVVFLIFYPILEYFNIFGENLSFLYLLLMLQIGERILAQYARALGKLKVFSLNGLLLTLNTGIFNILFLVVIKLGIEGYFWALVVAYSISVLYLTVSTKIFKQIKLTRFSKEKTKELLEYSLPLVPNSLMWWLINASSRYFIRIFVGVSANGLFAVASRIPSLITIFYQIFNQAWQISAIAVYDSKEKTNFYTNVFNILASFMFIGTAITNIFVKPIFLNLVSIEYYSGWIVVPLLLIGTVFSSFSSFLGSNYVAAKMTKGVFKTSVYGGVISLILNAVFIPTIGILGAGISSACSFLLMFLLRYVDTKKYVEMNINLKVIFSSLLLIIMQIILLNFDFTFKYDLMIGSITVLLLMLVNYGTLKLTLKYLVRKNK